MLRADPVLQELNRRLVTEGGMTAYKRDIDPSAVPGGGKPLHALESAWTLTPRTRSGWLARTAKKALSSFWTLTNRAGKEKRQNRRGRDFAVPSESVEFALGDERFPTVCRNGGRWRSPTGLAGIQVIMHYPLQ